MFAAFSCKTIFVTFFAKTLPRMDYENLNQEFKQNKVKVSINGYLRYVNIVDFKFIGY